MTPSPHIVLVGPPGSGKSTVAACLGTGEGPGLIDPPDFAAERRALADATAVIVVIGATDGIDPATTYLWREVAAAGLPRAIVVTKMDAQRADFDETCALIARLFDPHGCVALTLPVLDDDERVAGFLDLASGTITEYTRSAVQHHDAEHEHRELTMAMRTRLRDSLAALDLGMEDLGDAIASAQITPILGFAGPGCVGREELAQVVAHLAQAPSAPPFEWPGPLKASPADLVTVTLTLPADYARDVVSLVKRLPDVALTVEEPGDGTHVLTARGPAATLVRIPVDVHGMSDGTSQCIVTQ